MEYQRCNRCVMDNSTDSFIHFDENGFCNYCTEALEIKKIVYFPDSEGKERLEKLISRLKRQGKGKNYDCMMGISGGLDSSYLAYLGYKWGLRILAIHIDDGFDTDIASENIKKLCKACKIELLTVRPDSEQFYDLTKAFILAEVQNIAIPQDNILIAHLNKYAKKFKINTFLSGGNFAQESILKQGDGTNSFDMTLIKDIHERFGTKNIDRLLFINNARRVINKYVYNFQSIRPLNYIDYNRERAIRELYDFCGFTYYEFKHCENYFTKIAQLYWLVNKFGDDKRTSHLSSLIVSGQITRDNALIELEKPLYDNNEIEKDLKIVLEKLDIPRDEFEKIIRRAGKRYSDYKTSGSYKFIKKYFKRSLLKYKN